MNTFLSPPTGKIHTPRPKAQHVFRQGYLGFSVSGFLEKAFWSNLLRRNEKLQKRPLSHCLRCLGLPLTDCLFFGAFQRCVASAHVVRYRWRVATGTTGRRPSSLPSSWLYSSWPAATELWASWSMRGQSRHLSRF